MVALRRADEADVGCLSRTLSRAFYADPVAAYFFPDEARRRRQLEAFFVLQLRHNYLPRGEVFLAGNGGAGALWLPPHAARPRIVDRLAHLAYAPRLGNRLASTRRLGSLLLAEHPAAPHYYLGTLGTDPDLQGRGLASALVEDVLRRCDASGWPVYLECSRRETVDFYARHGFTVQSEVEAPGGGPRLWLMWRPARLVG